MNKFIDNNISYRNSKRSTRETFTNVDFNSSSMS